MSKNQLSRRLGKNLAIEFRNNGFSFVRSNEERYVIFRALNGKVAIVPKRVNDRKIYRKILREAGL